MGIPVKLKDVIDEMEPIGYDYHALINRKTGVIVAFNGEQAALAEQPDKGAPDWLQERLPEIREALNSEDFVELPDQFEFDEYNVMRRFCEAHENDAVRERLLTAIRGRGAFRCFKDAVYDLGIDQEWYAWRDAALRELAVEFLVEQGIAYIE